MADFVDVRGCKTHVRRLGSGPTLLFLHGVRGIRGTPPFLERLAERFEVVAPDHPGFGDSDDPEWLDTIGDLAYFYADFIEALGLRDVHLVGHEIGGWIALQYAVRCSAGLRSLSLVSSAGIRLKGVPRADIFMASPEELGRLFFLDEKLARAFTERTNDPDRFASYFKNSVTSAKLTWQPRLCDPHLSKWLHRVKVPTFILWGDSDRVIPPEYAHALHAAITGSRLTILEGCGHVPAVERLDQFVGALTNFIEKAAS
jgi:pimeloyl-ACP methyl ester carboxylesterase